MRNTLWFFKKKEKEIRFSYNIRELIVNSRQINDKKYRHDT